MRFVSSATFLAALLLVAPAKAATLKVDYHLTLAGLPLGTAALDGAFEGERYTLNVKAQLTGIAGLMTGSGKGAAVSTGTITGTRISPQSFAASGKSSSTTRTLQIGIEGDSAKTVEIEPPFEPKPDRVPLTDAHKRGIIDPLSGMIAVAQNRQNPVDPQNCNRTVPVFDGTQRFNVVLSYAGTKPLAKPGFPETVLVCNARYLPIAGHRALRPAVKFMAENRDMDVWLAPVEGTRLLVPVRVSVRTMYGVSVLEADKWALAAGPAPARPVTR